MYIKDIKTALTKGLLAGYGGKTKFSKNLRGSFKTTSNHFEDNGVVYHDEWVEGGGQELIKVKGESFTRVYAGGVIKEETLEKLGITKEQVIKNLVFRINDLGDRTRLFDDCRTKIVNDWGYRYEVIGEEKEIDLTIGKEVISYKGQIVFEHIFLLNPVKTDEL